MPAVAPRRPTAPASRLEAEGASVATTEREASPLAGPMTTRFVWTRERYDRAVDAGVLGPDDKVELIEGRIVHKMAQNEPHAVVTGLVSDALRDAFGRGTHVRDEKPIALSDLSAPEPDLVVVPGTRRDYLDGHPAPEAVLLLVEVADSSLLEDRSRKARIYAEAGVPEYWIVNIQSRVLEVFRDPVDGVYGTKATLGLEDAVVPVHAPDASIPVADLLP